MNLKIELFYLNEIIKILPLYCRNVSKLLILGVVKTPYIASD